MTGCRVFDGTEYEGVTLEQFRDAVARKDMTVGTLADLLAKLPRDRPVIVRQDDGTETNLRMLLCAHDDSTDTFDPVCRLFAGPCEREQTTGEDRDCCDATLQLFAKWDYEQRCALDEYRRHRTLEERVAGLELLHSSRLTGLTKAK